MTHSLTNKQKIFLTFIAVLSFLNILAWQEVFAVNGPHFLKVDALDVGQGDSIFIQTPQMRHILIDGGPGSVVLGKLVQ